MSSKIVRVFNERCEADAYCAVRACSHKRMYADRLKARQRDMSMKRMRNANGTAQCVRLTVYAQDYIMLSTLCGQLVDKYVSSYVFSLLRIHCFWLIQEVFRTVDTCFYFMHMHMDSSSDYCKLTCLYKGPSTLFLRLSTSFSSYSHPLHKKTVLFFLIKRSKMHIRSAFSFLPVKPSQLSNLFLVKNSLF